MRSLFSILMLLWRRKKITRAEPSNAAEIKVSSTKQPSFQRWTNQKSEAKQKLGGRTKRVTR